MSAYLSPGGACDEVVQTVISYHDLLTGVFVFDEVEGVLTDKFSVPSAAVHAFLSLYRKHHVEPLPAAPYPLPIDDPDDPWVVASAVNAGADVLVTGDKRLRRSDLHVPEFNILLPAEFLQMPHP